MNLHKIASRAIGRINPMIPATIQSSNGYTIGAGGVRTPTYDPPRAVQVQVQALSNDELHQIDGLNLQGNVNAVYLDGVWNGVVRAGKQGGDILTFAGQTWLVATVLENWPDWTKVAVVQQNGGSPLKD